MAFVSLIVIGYVCGNFIKGISEWALTHLVNITKSICGMIYKIVFNVFQFTKLKLKLCFNRVKKFFKNCIKLGKYKAGIEVGESDSHDDSDHIH